MRKTDARDAYVARAAESHTKLAKLRQPADKHFGHDPETVHWGHVDDPGRVETALDDLLASIDGQSASVPPRRSRRILVRCSRSSSMITLSASTAPGRHPRRHG